MCLGSRNLHGEIREPFGFCRRSIDLYLYIYIYSVHGIVSEYVGFDFVETNRENPNWTLPSGRLLVDFLKGGAKPRPEYNCSPDLPVLGSKRPILISCGKVIESIRLHDSCLSTRECLLAEAWQTCVVPARMRWRSVKAHGAVSTFPEFLLH